MSEVHLAASIEGPDDAPVVILANPIGTTREIWDAQARVLREDFRLLRFELRGHGPPGAQSGAPPGPYSIAELGTDVLGLMREYGVTAAAYCGISIGGMIGLWLAANAQERISSLVVCCAAITPMPSRQSWLDRAALVRSGGDGGDQRDGPAALVHPGLHRPPARRRGVRHGHAARHRPGGLRGLRRGHRRDGPAAARSARSRLPTLVIAGAEDLGRAAVAGRDDQTAAGIADSRLRVIRGAGRHLAAPTRRRELRFDIRLQGDRETVFFDV